MVSCPCGRETVDAYPFNALTLHDIPQGVVTCRLGHTVYFHPEQTFALAIDKRGDGA